MDVTSGYLRTPSISADTIAFVTEDDLWTVSADGGVARRLTANLSEVTRPALSPDGEWVAFTSRDEHHAEVYAMPARGGEARRLTWLGANSVVRGWAPRGKILFASDHARAFLVETSLRTIGPAGGAVSELAWGPATEAAWSTTGAVVVGRHTIDPARWKRYRGGRVGQLWIDRHGDGDFRRVLADLGGNLAHPMWIGDRVWFVSDHEGIGNVYSCRPTGSDVRRHTEHERYYARFAATDGRRIVYAHAADIWLLDPVSGDNHRVAIDLNSPRVQRHRRFAPAARHLSDATVHPAGHSLAVETRGKLFTSGLFEGAVRQVGWAEGVRYRLPRWMGDGGRLACVSDASGEDGVEIYTLVPASADAAAAAAPAAAPASAAAAAPAGRRRRGLRTLRGSVVDDGACRRIEGLDLGGITDLAVPGSGSVLAVTNHRYELTLLDTETGTATVVDESEHAGLDGLSWSADGRWLAYSIATTTQTRSIKVCDATTGTTHLVTGAEFRDYAPAWDPEGRYLYFLSTRVFNPVADMLYFDLGFPRASRPYLVTLRADVDNPFIPPPRGFNAPPAKANGAAPAPAPPPADDAASPPAPPPAASPAAPAPPAAPTAPAPLAIDFAGIEGRVLPVPVPEGRYTQVAGLPTKVLFASRPVEGSLGRTPFDTEAQAVGNLEMFDLVELRHDVLAGGVNTFTLSRDNSTVVYDGGHKLRAIRAGEKPPDGTDREPPGRKSGWIDLGRIKVSIDPGAEWRQMFGEAWRLQRDHFWVADLSGVDWDEVRRRYAPLVDRVATRLEFSDLMWEMQGELGTSHAYEIGGDYRPVPAFAMGHLGADLRLEPRSGKWRVAALVDGDPWEPDAGSPLAGPGAAVKPGDAIVAINGLPVTAEQTPAALLVNQAGMLVELVVEPARGERRTITVRALRDDRAARYREWVKRNRRAVHEATDGRVGYVHIPDMGAQGYAEFHRSYLSEVGRDALIVDVRYNGGGNVSQLVLEKLGRRRLGYDVPRHGQPEPYPSDSPAGPLVAIADENAGSDGDIFTHCFKLMGLGPVVGKRTWGGVIGISPRHLLADGGLTTQPEYSFWFTDVGWGVENHGTEPDHDVDIRPQDWAAGIDPQMDRALQLIQRALRTWKPPRPDLGHRPHLALPTLPRAKAPRR